MLWKKSEPMDEKERFVILAETGRFTISELCRDIIQQLLGHSTLESTQIYTEVSIRHLQEVHAKTRPGYSKSGRKGSFKA